jgi:hypothetical protein
VNIEHILAADPNLLPYFITDVETRYMRANAPNEADKIAAAIINQSWLDAGHTQEELDQSHRIADLLDRIVASGRSMESVLDEWQGKTAEEILATCCELESADHPLSAHDSHVKVV